MVKIFFDNVNFGSNSGPNNFAKKLASQIKEFNNDDLIVVSKENNINCQISFIQTNLKLAPNILRLDGIYFNSEQSWKEMNEPIKNSYESSDAIVYQSGFNKFLIEKYFGLHDNSYVIHNGTRIDWVNSISPLEHKDIDKFENIWCCASSWRPHKRLKENINYFFRTCF